jgi:hypothetical protein
MRPHADWRADVVDNLSTIAYIPMVETNQWRCVMKRLFYVQYQSVDKQWYDQAPTDDMATAIELCVVYQTRSPQVRYRAIERTDRVIYPPDQAIDPAKELGS